MLLIGIIVALILCRRRRQRQRRESSRSEFFPDRLVSRPNSLDSASEKRLTARMSTVSVEPPNADLDQLELAGPQLLIQSAISTPGVFLGDIFAVVPTTTEQAEYPASCQASIIDMTPPSPSPSSDSTATRQEQLASEVHMAREEIGALENRRSARGDVEEGDVRDAAAARRIEELYARIQELEREQAALRLEVEMSMEGYPPPDYASNEG
jgi:hypothetical protein